jgi:hypothetical protein
MPVVGAVTVSGTPNVAVTNLPATQAVSAVALPLPAGAAADSTLTGGGAKTQGVDASGNVLGTAGHPTRVDPTGTTTQPVSVAALPLPTGAALDATLTARFGALGQKAMAGSAPVVIASDQSPVPISGSVTLVGATDGLALDATVTARLGTLGQKVGASSTPVVVASDQSPLPISATALPLPTGAALDSTLTGGTAKAQTVDGSGNVLGTSAHPTRVDPTGTTTQPVSVAALPLPTGAALDATISARLGTLGQKTGAGSTPVVVASDQGPLPVTVAALPLPTGAALDATLTGGTQKTLLFDGTNNIGTAAHPVPVTATSTPAPSTTPALSRVAGSITSVTLLAANSLRRGAIIFNESAATLYLKLGTTASLTSYSYPILPNQLWELAFAYTGELDGIWATATGNAQITELT